MREPYRWGDATPENVMRMRIRRGPRMRALAAWRNALPEASTANPLNVTATEAAAAARGWLGVASPCGAAAFPSESPDRPACVGRCSDSTESIAPSKDQEVRR